MRKNPILAAVLFVTGALFLSCSKYDKNVGQPAEAQEIRFSATLAPKHGDVAQTRAIIDNNGTMAWTFGEQIAIYYETSDGHATAIATVSDPPYENGSANITATFDADKAPVDGGEAKFVYPASLHNGAGDIDESKLLTGQRGVLTPSGSGTDYSISTCFDAATATGKIVLTGSTTSYDVPTTATVTSASGSGNVTLTNRVCICKFTFSVSLSGSSSMISALQAVDIHIDGRTYSISPSRYNSDHCLYVAMLPCTGADALFGAYNYGQASGDVTLYGENYVKLAKNVTLEAGKFYTNIPIVCVSATEYSGNKTTPLYPGKEIGAIILNNVDFAVHEDSAINIVYDPEQVTPDFIILLKGNNTVSSIRSGSCAIEGPKSALSLTIGGNGSLTASAVYHENKWGAAIGGANQGYVGNINIHGTIQSLTANGGIGAGYGGSVNSVTIDGVLNPTSDSTYPHLTRSGDTWTHK